MSDGICETSICESLPGSLTQLAESRLHKLLPLERGLVLAVLAQIAHLDGSANLLRQRDAQLVLKTLGFFPQFFLEYFDHAT